MTMRIAARHAVCTSPDKSSVCVLSVMFDKGAGWANAMQSEFTQYEVMISLRLATIVGRLVCPHPLIGVFSSTSVIPKPTRTMQSDPCAQG